MNARLYAVAGLVCLLAGCSEKSSTGSITVTAPTPTPTTSTPTITAVNVSGTTDTLTQAGATTQFTATVTLSTGATEDRTSSATWTSENGGVASVSGQGLVTAVGDGQTTITATVGQMRGTRPVGVRLPKRAADPAPGQRLPMPDIRAFVAEASAARPDLIGQSCPGNIKYVTNPWLDYIVDKLREVDTRWGYNAKPTRSAGDNGGQPVVAAGDEVAYHYSAGPDEGSTEVYLVDVLEGHCGPTPRVTYRVFTGEEPGRWTGARRF
ncbi:MAG TPA: Ig-like domain-containing protein [Luteitalea sp.]|nr:Ig-like domain-containing protein [Luteitalea sp.]